MPGPRMRLSGPVLSASDPVALARFYQRLLGWAVVGLEEAENEGQPWTGWAKLRSPDQSQKMEFQGEEHYRAPDWPSIDGGQLMMVHLDIGTEDLDAGVAWAVEIGGSVAPHQPQADVRVILDPAGHPFCLFLDRSPADGAG